VLAESIPLLNGEHEARVYFSACDRAACRGCTGSLTPAAV
jgi:hypothetical protein